ncbi:Ig-like domain-containing protein [Gemella sanguinis]|uniref:Ig-like domain-containing protein n=1 Tax=Gemella sanguinis TaxID=84135 RepID=UPI00352D3116
MKKIIFTITTFLMILVFGGYATATEIKVENPDVKVTTSGDRFSPVNVEYKTKFSDDLKINSGDKVIFNLPQELNLQTSYNFDVNSVEGAVVGKATASVENNNVTTVFNDYFTNKPLNKSMQLSLMTVWNKEKVTGKDTTTYDLNFNGTIVTTKVDKDGVPDPQEIVTKWGTQNGDTINWAGRVNYKKANLTNVTITDKWDSNQEYVPGSLKARILSSIDPWTKIGEVAKENIEFNSNGFTIKLPALNEIVSLEYSTKVKDLSKNPTNNLRIQADNNVDWDKDVEVQIAKGDGSVEGENKPEPTFDIPNEAPVVDKPELNLNDVPLLPPAPVVEKPYLDLKDIPKMPPAPVVEIPELPLEDIPMMPPAPVVEKPELEIPETPNKVERPKITKVDKKTVVEKKVRKLANTGLKNDDLTLLVVLMMAAALVIKREKGRRYER